MIIKVPIENYKKLLEAEKENISLKAQLTEKDGYIGYWKDAAHQDRLRASKSEAELAEKSRMIAHADELLLEAANKVDILYVGCDTADALADEILELRARF